MDTNEVTADVVKAEVLVKAEVYKAISTVTKILAQEGIPKAKEAKGAGGSYRFRGIDDVYSVLAPALVKAGLVIVPRVIGRSQTERTSKAGGTLICTTVDVEYDIVSVADGSAHTARCVGEAMDSGDKSTSKALSMAYKYLAFELFSIPVEGMDDGDRDRHEIHGGEGISKDEKKETSEDDLIAGVKKKTSDVGYESPLVTNILDDTRTIRIEKESPKATSIISDDQRKFFFAKCHEAGLNNPQVKAIMALTIAKDSTKDMTSHEMDTVLAFVNDAKKVAEFKINQAKQEVLI